MKSIILALLPGLEEETGEFFEKVGGNTFFIVILMRILRSFSGSQSVGSIVGSCISVILLPKYMVDHAYNAFCSRDFSQFPCPPPSTFEFYRR
jgi:hypothetical protein